VGPSLSRGQVSGQDPVRRQAVKDSQFRQAMNRGKCWPVGLADVVGEVAGESPIAAVS
jgi:hypothetical protein